MWGAAARRVPELSEFKSTNFFSEISGETSSWLSSLIIDARSSSSLEQDKSAARSSFFRSIDSEGSLEAAPDPERSDLLLSWGISILFFLSTDLPLLADNSDKTSRDNNSLLARISWSCSSLSRAANMIKYNYHKYNMICKANWESITTWIHFVKKPLYLFRHPETGPERGFTKFQILMSGFAFANCCDCRKTDRMKAVSVVGNDQVKTFILTV